MKKIFLTLSVLSLIAVSGQKREIKNAFEAVESGNFNEANTELSKAESVINGKTETIEPNLLEEYYFAKGASLLKSGKISDGAVFLSKISDLKSSKIYVGKDSNRNKVYFVGKENADKSGISDLKEETFESKTFDKVVQIVNPILKTTSDSAFQAYQSKNYSKAASLYKDVYYLLKSVGNDDKTYLYYSAISSSLANSKEEAIKTYSELIDSGYTGVTTLYKAKNKKTNSVENFDKNSFETLKRLGNNSDYTDFKTETTPSVEQDLYEQLASLLLSTEKYEQALTLIDKGIKKFPKSNKLIEYQGTAYYKSGKTEEFINNLKLQLEKNPNDKVNWYNLAVLQSKDPSKLGDAENSFKKSLEIDPNYIPAIQGLFYSVYTLGDGGKVIEEAEAARKAKKTDLFNKILSDRRERFQKAIPYLERWYSLEPKNLDIVSLLKGVYQTVHNDAKFKEMKQVEENLKKNK